MKKMMFLLAIVALLILSGCGQKKNYDEFANCLTASNFTMYGAYWCPHCQTVKNEFGNAFRFINYVECDARGPNPNPDKCKLDGIQYYPSFKFADGSLLFGEVSFEIMAEKTGCELP